MNDEQPDETGFATKAIHAGREPDYASMPIYMASTSKDFYTRGGNPTINALEKSVAELEGGRRAMAAACGMSAISQTLLTLLKSGDRVVAHTCVYDWAGTFLFEEAPKFGIQTVQVDMRDPNALKEALSEPTRLVYFEPLTNPTLDVVDPKPVVAAAHEAGALVVADNSFLTPALLRPLEFGVDVVIHSATKFLCGHSDSLGGIVVANAEELIKALRRGRNIYGGVISPFNAFLILRGISTLHVRMDRHCANAQKVAEFLSGHRRVEQTRYPGLPGDSGHETAQARLGGFGGMVGFVIRGGRKASQTFAASLKLCKPWVSLGDVQTLVYPRLAEPRRGIREGYVRVSVGLEDADDIIRDIDQALSRAG